MKIKNKSSVHESEPAASSDFKFSKNMSKSEIAALSAELESDLKFERDALNYDMATAFDAAEAAANEVLTTATDTNKSNGYDIVKNMDKELKNVFSDHEKVRFDSITMTAPSKTTIFNVFDEVSSDIEDWRISSRLECERTNFHATNKKIDIVVEDYSNPRNITSDIQETRPITGNSDTCKISPAKFEGYVRKLGKFADELIRTYEGDIDNISISFNINVEPTFKVKMKK